MIAYNKEYLDNASITDLAKKWLKQKLINGQAFEAIRQKYPVPLYTPNIFIRLGLFIFTLICLNAASALVLLFTAGFESSSVYNFGIRFFIHGIFILFFLENLVQKKKLFRSGIDEAFLYMGLSSIIGGVTMLFSELDLSFEDHLLLFCFIALPFLVAASIRYIDILTTVCSFVCAFLIVFLLVSKTGPFAKVIMPFLVMFLSAFVYLQAAKLRKQDRLRFWDSPLLILEILSLVLFYLAGNYFIVRTLSEELFSLQLEPGEDIPLAFFFYAYTVLIPGAYIYWGLKKKNRILLQTGLILVAASVLTFKYYYSLGHHEITFTISGSIMIAVAWLSIRYLKTPRHGITFAEDKEEKFLEKFDSEALIIAQSFSQTPTENNGPDFGGGKFGGGGAQSDF